MWAFEDLKVFFRTVKVVMQVLWILFIYQQILISAHKNEESLLIDVSYWSEYVQTLNVIIS